MTDEHWTLQHEQIARWAARDRFIAGADHEDLVQEARIGVVKAIRTWDPARGQSMNSWLRTCAHTAVITALIASRRRKHQVFNDAVRFERAAPDIDGMTIGDMIPGGVDPVRVVIAREEARDLLQRIAGLTPLERDSVIGVRVHGEEYASRPDSKRVDNALQRATRKLRAATDEAPTRRAA